MKQAAAAVGQCRMMHIYDKLFSEYNRSVAQILLTGESKGKVESYAGILCRDLKEKTKTLQYTQTRIIGPGEAAIGKINDEYRYVIYIKAPGLGAITTLRDYIDTCGCEGVTISVDMNPMTVC